MDNTPLRNNPTLQSCITNAFCYLLSSMDDRSTYVATRATLLLPTIHDYALKVSNMLSKKKKKNNCFLFMFIFIIVGKYVKICIPILYNYRI